MKLNIDEFKNVPVFDRESHMKNAVSRIGVGHLVVECGVFHGRSINWIADCLPEKTIHGFDTFEGLPEEWDRGKSVFEIGRFHMKGERPNVRKNVLLYKGLFQKTLPVWSKVNDGSLSLLHIDCDIYSGAKAVLDILNNKIVPGTILVFDELCDWKNSGVYDNWESHEWRALNEWVSEMKRGVRPFSRGAGYESSMEVIF